MAGDQQSQTITTAGTVTWTRYYPTIIIGNYGASPVTVRTDGTAAAAGANNTAIVPPGGTVTMANQQALPSPDPGSYSPQLTPGWTNQLNDVTYTSGSPTYVSVAGTVTSVIVSVQ